MAKRKKVVICGAAGRDFHNFNMLYRHNPNVEVIAFTATQIPNIDNRSYPAQLAGALYPHGIPIRPERELTSLCKTHDVDEVIFAYSDVSHDHVMNVAATANAADSALTLVAPRTTMLATRKPAIAVCAVRTGCGKSQVTRFISQALTALGYKTAVIRHPMPYGDLTKQSVQRFECATDLDEANCTLEEREEYEPHIQSGGIVFAGVDYGEILAAAEDSADVILWDGGNNDHAFIDAGFNIAMVDALRPQNIGTHYPGLSVLRMADLVIVNKVDTATDNQLAEVHVQLDTLAGDIPRIFAASPVRLESPELLDGARVMIIEDGPTITHGGMQFGAGYQAVKTLQHTEIIDPRNTAVAGIAKIYEQYPHIGPVLPATGYSEQQRTELAATINAADIDFVVSGSPIDLAHALDLNVPVVRVHYDYQDTQAPGLMHYVEDYLARHS